MNSIYNDFVIVCKTFSAKEQHFSTILKIMKAVIKAKITYIKSFNQIHNLNLSKYFILKDFKTLHL